MPTNASSQAPSQTPALPPASATTIAPNSTMAGVLVIALTLSLVLIAFGYKKYRAAQRSRVLKRQIALLETMWRLSSTKRKF